MSNRMSASVSLDLDNLWSYMKTHGTEGWESRPSYYDKFVPHMIDVLDRQDMKITFFIVGVDADDEKNHAALRQLAEAGHEFGNHSYEHEPWLHLYSAEQLEDEIVRTDRAIERVTGQRTVGFRGPGYSWSPDLLRILVRHGHAFDASTLPTYIGPLARMYYFWTADLSKEERKQRKGLFGQFSDGIRPLKPYYWDLGNDESILEIPVTTIPVVKVPFHFSYLLYLAGYSEKLMMAYLKTAIWMCKITRTEPSFLLHPLDVIGEDQVEELGFFPGMDKSGAYKTELLVKVLHVLADNFDLVPMGEHARRIRERDGLSMRVPTAMNET
ncbi:MAG: polysaccharide deacetylase family protein [Woeseiaceae bacterium]|nr:polysaccharide deacetylase family protein [Woeseiaceae bacterium]